MAKNAAAFTQSDVTRALKGAKAAGVEVSRVEIDKAGKIVMVTGKPDGSPADDADDKGASEWDRI